MLHQESKPPEVDLGYLRDARVFLAVRSGPSEIVLRLSLNNAFRRPYSVRIYIVGDTVP